MATIIERFEKKYLKTGGCWEWTASKNFCGYGQFRVLDKMTGSHRVSYEIYCGEIPDGLHVLHKCDNPACVNPSHLFLGTHQENMKDRDEKGRNKNVPRGSASGKSKLTERDVAEIRSVENYHGVCADLGRKFSVSKVLISLIRRNQGWQHVKAEAAKAGV